MKIQFLIKLLLFYIYREEKRLSRLSINDGIIELEQENKSESEEEWNFSSEDDNNKKFNTENISDYVSLSS